MKDSTLYTTTFPCHDCAKHIVAAGIARVIYVEPYPKSLAPELYPDSIDVEGGRRCLDEVTFEPFVGIAPRRYMDVFRMGIRKDREGNTVSWEASKAVPRFRPSWVYLERERAEVAKFRKKLRDKKLS